MRIALAHDYLSQRGGAERVALAIARALGVRRIFTSVYNPATTYPEFADFEVVTSGLNQVPLFRRDPRCALPLLPSAVEGLRIDDVDLVVCSSSGWAHGVTTDARKVVYCHNTARWLYQRDDYFGRGPSLARSVLSGVERRLKRWDRDKALSADTYLCNSAVVADRVRTHYGIEAEVLHPPRGLSAHGPAAAVPGLEPGYLLTVGRPRGYKHTDVVRDAVAGLPRERLVSVGGGGAPYANVVDLHGVSDEQLRWLYANADALVACSYEDFGLTPVEAYAFGKPVLALDAGGYRETVSRDVSGLFIEDLSIEAIRATVRRFRRQEWNDERIRAHGESWSEEQFAQRLREKVGAVAA
ncbi:glycosyltransferase [Vallicoccus soli]|uniref:Glycosyltransferase n=1 Tax=Vallicoccus soli TaxID=2339232 RepID=A0A3A3Z5E5_9ACTN|nr:glycosyltransferase [Vallicoccus soli]RJK98178.1 glycosyltransferase [Vallicoccus soli]